MINVTRGKIAASSIGQELEYAKCGNCGWCIVVFTVITPHRQEPGLIQSGFNYCPACGEHKHQHLPEGLSIPDWQRCFDE